MAIGDSGLTKLSTNRADLNCANALACNPMFSPPTSCVPRYYAPAFHIQKGLLSIESYKGKNIDISAELPQLHEDLFDKFLCLRYLAGINSSPGCRLSIGKEEQILWSDRLYCAERELRLLSNKYGSQNFVASCSIAAILFIDNELRSIEFCAQIMGRHVTRLKLSLSSFLDQGWTSTAFLTTPMTMLWSLYVGGIAAGSRSERGWFVARLLEICDHLEITSWEDTRAVLKSFLWSAAWEFEGLLLWISLEVARATETYERSSPRRMKNNEDFGIRPVPTR